MAISVRDFERICDYQACVRLQMEVWGFSAADAVPEMHLLAMHHFGGLCIGAFDDEIGGDMVGFVCGFSGWDGRRPFHHSHMLAVQPSYRGQRLGERLKWAQRDRALAQGIDWINWTFDPLQAPNANLNINRLGAIVRKYRVNLYGESRSPLHGGVPTDRFEAEWLLRSERVEQAREGHLAELPDWENLPRVNRVRNLSGFLACEDELELDRADDAVLIELPRTINDLMAADKDLALDWRMKLRRICQAYFARSYSIRSVHRAGNSAFYRLEREDVPGE